MMGGSPCSLFCCTSQAKPGSRGARPTYCLVPPRQQIKIPMGGRMAIRCWRLSNATKVVRLRLAHLPWLQKKVEMVMSPVLLVLENLSLSQVLRWSSFSVEFCTKDAKSYLVQKLLFAPMLCTEK